MAQEVNDLHWTLDRRGAVAAVQAGLVDREALPLRDVFVHGVVQSNEALFDQLHEGDAGDRLGHRVDAVDCVLADRNRPLDVGHAQRAEVGDLAAAADDCEGPGDLAGVDVAGLEEAVNPPESLLGDAGDACVDDHMCSPYTGIGEC